MPFRLRYTHDFFPPDVPDPSESASPRAEFLAGAREIAPVLIGTMPFGFVAGVAAVGAGMTPLQGIALSLFAFSGIAQLVVAQLVAAQSPIVVTLAAVLVVSLRHLMYSAAMSPHLAHLPRRWRVVMAYLMTDQSFALGVQRFTAPGARGTKHFYMLGASLTLFTSWQAAVVIGAVAGAQIPPTWSLDFIVTLSFIVLLVPALRTRADLAAGIVAAAIALIAAGLPYKFSLVLASIAGIAAGMAFEWAHRR